MISSTVFADRADGNMSITIFPGQSVGKVNPLIFGNNMIGYDPYVCGSWTKEYAGYSNYGSGIWDPHSRHSVPDVINLAKEAGMTIARFPGGGCSATYNWKKTIGPPEKRPNFLYGLDEFLKTCEETGSEAVFTLPYFTGEPQDAADLVEYLNAPCDESNPGGGIDWANERAKNGHPEPYNVKFFELGNEVYSGVKGFPGVAPGIYAKDYLNYREIMRAIDPAVKLGAVTVNSDWSKGISPWNSEVFKIAGNSIDFLIEHTYRPSGINAQKANADKMFTDTLNSLAEVDNYFKKISDHFQMETGRTNIPVAVTEYNGFFVQDDPVPYRYSLGTALFNAGLLQVFMNPGNNILMANYWQFVNEYWGMIKNDKFMELKGTYIKRPNYYVFEMFHKHFGGELVDVKINDASGLQVFNKEDDMLSGINWQVRPVSGASVKLKKDEVEVSFPGDGDLNFYHVYKKAPAKPNTTYHISGYLKAEDLKDNEGVCITINDGRGWNATHSATTTERVWGTTDWVHVETDYTTLSDAAEVAVLVRRVSGQGLVKGKVFVRDIKLTQQPDKGPKGKDALSVSASKSKDGKKYYLMVLNKNVFEDIVAAIHMDGSDLLKNIDVWTLNGASVDATNEKDPDRVNITHKSVKLPEANGLNYLFPAHSLTSLEFKSQ